ncbi:MAG TPA: hypothetical protein VIS48_05520 [Candidatus Kryptonia bacterium]
MKSMYAQRSDEVKKIYFVLAIFAARFRSLEDQDWYRRLTSAAMIELGEFSKAIGYLEKISQYDNVSLSSLAGCRM